MKVSTNNEIGKKKRKEEDGMGEEGACWRNLAPLSLHSLHKSYTADDKEHRTKHNTDRTMQVSDGWWNTRQIAQLVTRKRAKQGEGLDRGLASKRARERSPLPTHNTQAVAQRNNCTVTAIDTTHHHCSSIITRSCKSR
jgi:hypothetical protein